jgi:hypothetical protein
MGLSGPLLFFDGIIVTIGFSFFFFLGDYFF